jgi:superoxide dismutase, Fe-Mn family
MFKLRPLPYAYDALEPYIQTHIMELHHDMHQQAYVNNLNKALENYPNLQKESLEGLVTSLDMLPENIRTAVRNNAGGDLNHGFFWDVMKKNGSGSPRDKVAQAIKKKFGTFDKFKEDFTVAAKGVFGSGWAWLVITKEGELGIMSTANQDSPLIRGAYPILGLDVWEHAYYLQYENRRPDYIDAWWSVVNWDRVEDNYKMMME